MQILGECFQRIKWIPYQERKALHLPKIISIVWLTIAPTTGSTYAQWIAHDNVFTDEILFMHAASDLYLLLTVSIMSNWQWSK